MGWGLIVKTEDGDVGALGKVYADIAGGEFASVDFVELVAEFEGAAADGGVRGRGVGRVAAEGFNADGVLFDFGGAAGDFEFADVAEEIFELFAAGEGLAVQDAG